MPFDLVVGTVEKFGLKKLTKLVEATPLKDGFNELLECLEDPEKKLLDKLFDVIYQEGYKDAREFYAKQASQNVAVAAPPPPAPKKSAASEEAVRNSVQQVIGQIKLGKINLPVFPHVAKKVLAMLDDANLTVQKMSRELQYDQTISSKLISISNSAFYGGASQTKNLETAIVKIGLLEVRKHLYSIATKDIFKLESEIFRTLIDRLANHATAAANAAFMAARYTGQSDHERYLLLTLFHDIGKLWIVKILNDIMSMDKKMEADVAEDSVVELFNLLHVKMGASLMLRWEFEKSFADMVLRHHGPIDPSDKTLCIVQFGNFFAKSLGYSVLEGEPHEESLAALAGVLKLKDDTLEKIRTELTEFMDIHTRRAVE
ncbi:MAG: hypothetical protein A2284_09305 [Deltaproteobacteria bacterium RIFOXYA12_FULL_61_11]|nr:MAG: hypothetical protein A2284_09305 [Deltaproteobacteria bacterium RIFOXYA12_FULL_61_11]